MKVVQFAYERLYFVLRSSTLVLNYPVRIKHLSAHRWHWYQTMANTNHFKSFLDEAKVAPEVFELRPDYPALLLAVDGINPGPSDDTSNRLLQEAEATASTIWTELPVTDIPRIAAWRETYKAFGPKPNKTRNSLESLDRRVQAGLPRVNRLTDIYNAVSVKHQIPFGGEDLKKYSGSPPLTRATGREDFETVAGGQPVVEHPNMGEVVWCDDLGVTCRHWNWRQCSRTVLTEETTSALFIVDALEPVTDEALTAAGDELITTLQTYCPDLRVASRTISRLQGDDSKIADL